MLTAKRVEKIFMDSLFRDGEDTSNAVRAEGVLADAGFHPERLESHRAEIAELLNELPDEFKKSAGGGWSFLNACEDRNGVQWGEHVNVEQLVMLGIATSMLKYSMPREFWPALPGGVPYFTVEA